jgi:hypothetical protein
MPTKKIPNDENQELNSVLKIHLVVSQTEKGRNLWRESI